MLIFLLTEGCYLVTSFLRDNPLLVQSNTSASRRLKGFVHGNRLPTEGRDILGFWYKFTYIKVSYLLGEGQTISLPRERVWKILME